MYFAKKTIQTKCLLQKKLLRLLISYYGVITSTQYLLDNFFIIYMECARNPHLFIFKKKYWLGRFYSWLATFLIMS